MLLLNCVYCMIKINNGFNVTLTTVIEPCDRIRAHGDHDIPWWPLDLCLSLWLLRVPSLSTSHNLILFVRFQEAAIRARVNPVQLCPAPRTLRYSPSGPISTPRHQLPLSIPVAMLMPCRFYVVHQAFQPTCQTLQSA